MKLRRAFLLAIIVAAVPAMLFGTGGFSTVNAERNADIAVADDPNAYLEIIKPEDPWGVVGGNSFTVLRLGDRLPGNAVLKRIETGSSSVNIETTTPAHIGDSLAVRVTCVDETEIGTVEFTIGAESSSAKVIANRPVRIDCLEPTVTFNGCGSVTVAGDARLFPLDATFTIEHNGTESTKNVRYSHSEETISKGETGKIAAVDINGETYTNDDSNSNSCNSNKDTGARR